MPCYIKNEPGTGSWDVEFSPGFDIFDVTSMEKDGLIGRIRSLRTFDALSWKLWSLKYLLITHAFYYQSLSSIFRRHNRKGASKIQNDGISQ
ncbi:hypothetical protein Zmor_002428 [Zophobas morio]|uniref:Uncharacterized protein n=1 Tax=Zophobas morio TaxID=2755281 RepID=A0AA38JA87_9CUCU|nr:hypothetical protein Zmor_002428 [Zophobas morio]